MAGFEKLGLVVVGCVRIWLGVQKMAGCGIIWPCAEKYGRVLSLYRIFWLGVEFGGWLLIKRFPRMEFVKGFCQIFVSLAGCCLVWLGVGG